LAEVLSAALTGMAFSFAMPDFAGPDYSMPGVWASSTS
jgi:hypothetical protein